MRGEIARVLPVNLPLRVAQLAVMCVAALLTAPAITYAQEPRFHRDCGAGKLLVSVTCQPIEAALAAAGGRVYWVAQSAPSASDANPGTRK